LPRHSVSNYQMREYRVKDRLGWAYAPVTHDPPNHAKQESFKETFKGITP